MEKTRLWTKNYLLVFIGNLGMCIGFYLVMPTLVKHLTDELGIDKTTVGTLMSAFFFASIFIRPVAGYIADQWNRRLLYLFTLIAFGALFVGYDLIGSVAMLLVLRILHGFLWGIGITTSNTLTVDVAPASRRGEALSIFGISTNLAMALAPMVGMQLMEDHSFKWVTYACMLCAGVSIIAILLLNPPKTDGQPKPQLTWRRFFFPQGIHTCIATLLFAIAYGITITYNAKLGESLGMEKLNIKLFYFIFAIGLILSRSFIGRIIDRGWLKPMAMVGLMVLAASYGATLLFASEPLFYALAALGGVSFGVIVPGLQTMTINMASAHERGAANSTFFTGYDGGIAIGQILGGYFAESYSYAASFSIGGGAALLSLIYFSTVAYSHYQRTMARGNVERI